MSGTYKSTQWEKLFGKLSIGFDYLRSLPSLISLCVIKQDFRWYVFVSVFSTTNHKANHGWPIKNSVHFSSLNKFSGCMFSPLKTSQRSNATQYFEVINIGLGIFFKAGTVWNGIEIPWSYKDMCNVKSCLSNQNGDTS